MARLNLSIFGAHTLTAFGHSIEPSRLDALFAQLVIKVMNNSSEFSREGSKEIVNEIREKDGRKPLNELGAKILEGMDRNLSYSKISEELEKDNLIYEEGHCRAVGAKILRELGECISEKVHKNNYKQVLMRHRQKQAPVDPYFYIERPGVDLRCKEEIEKFGALILLKSPKGMGKTLSSGKLLEYAKQHGYETARLDLNSADRSVLADANTFLYWLCVQCLKNLVDDVKSSELQSQINECWQEPARPRDNCSSYFQNYLLSNIKCPLVVCIDSFEVLFEFSDTCSVVFPLLRSWHEASKSSDRVGTIWRKLRVVLVYSTESYPKLKDVDESPFNVGVPIELTDFDLSEVTAIARQYELDEQLGKNGLQQLMKLLGGHPNLINQALISLKHKETTLEEFLSRAPTRKGIYRNYLNNQLLVLEKNPHLKSAYREVLIANKPVRLDPVVGFKLYGMGLVTFADDDCVPRYELHRQYFFKHLE